MASAGRLRFGRGATPNPLSDVTFLMGSHTIQGGGGVRLSSATLGLLNSGAPSGWTITQVSGTSGHFQDASGSAYAIGSGKTVPEGTSAISPQPSAAGVTAKLNGGPYVFQIFATGTFGTSNTIDFTIPIQANSASIGNNASFASAGALLSVSEAVFSTLTAPRYLLLSKGLELTGNAFTTNGFNFSAEAIMRDADYAAKSNLDYINLQNAKHLTFYKMRWNGPIWSAAFRVRLFGAVEDIKFDDCDWGEDASNLVLGKLGLACDGDATHPLRLSIENCRARYTFQALEITGKDVVIKNFRSRYQFRPCIHYGPCINITIESVQEMSFIYVAGTGYHTEGLQRRDHQQILTGHIKDYEVFAADSTWMGPGYFAGFGSVGDAPDTDMTVENFVYAGWYYTGLNVNSNAGASLIKNSTFVKVNTGTPDPSLGPDTGGFSTPQPSMGFGALEPALWTATLATQRCYMGNTMITGGDAVGQVSETLNRKRANVTTTIATDFATGNPNVVLPAISSATWAAMSDSDVVATYRAGLAPAALGGMYNAGDSTYTGAYLPDGSMNRA